MRFYKTERDTVWYILQFIGAELRLSLNSVLVDSFIIISKYHEYILIQKKNCRSNSEQLKVFKDGKLYKIICISIFLACKMNDISKTLDEIFSSLYKCIQQTKQANNSKFILENIIEFYSDENDHNNKFVISKSGNTELTDSFKYELVCVYELLILNSINFAPKININPFRYIKEISKKMKLGSFNICEKVTFFIFLILKSNKFLSIPVNIIVAASTEAAYKSLELEPTQQFEQMPNDVEQWIKSCKDKNFPDFENATSICCTGC